MLKAVIFDMDGVLVNSEPMHFRACAMVLEKYHKDLTFDFYKQFIGSTIPKLCMGVCKEYNLALTEEELYEQIRSNKQELIHIEGYQKIEGIPELLQNLQNAGMKLAVASSSAYNYIMEVTKALGIYDYFDVLVSGESVKNPKPAPDVFLKAVAKLEVRDKECIIIEDSMNGVLAAKAAGVCAIGFENPDSGDQDLRESAVIVQGFEEIDYEFINNVFRRAQKKPAIIAKTERLLIREMMVSDVQELYKIYEDEKISQYMKELALERSDEEASMEAYIETMYGIFGYGYWAVIDKETNHLIGRAGINYLEIEGESYIDLGYMIRKSSRRKGYAKEACEAIATYAREKLYIQDLHIFVEPDNAASIQLAVSLGFTYKQQNLVEGKIMDHYEKMLSE